MASLPNPGLRGTTQTGYGVHTPKPRKGTRGVRKAAAIRESRSA